MRCFGVADVLAYAFSQPGSGGDYRARKAGHCLIDRPIATPTSGYAACKNSGQNWGTAAFRAILVDIKTKSGAVVRPSGFGGEPACFLIQRHFRCRLEGAACRDTAWFWDEIFRARPLKEHVPSMKWTTGEHGYTRYGFRKLIATRAADTLQRDMIRVGGPTDVLRIAAMAAAYDIPVVPRGSGEYRYHFVMALPHTPLCEYLITSADASRVEPVFGTLFENENLPEHGRIRPSDAPACGPRLRHRTAGMEHPYGAR